MEFCMDNKFIIVVGSHNNAKWVDSNLDSILSQDYDNYKVLYYDDASTDNTSELVAAKVKNNLKFRIGSHTERRFKTWFYANSNYLRQDLKDNDILVFLDGDDMFHCENVLSYLNQIYKETNCWLTYGGMAVWEGGDKVTAPYPQNSEIPVEVVSKKAYRRDTWRTSHLKTMRGFVWKSIDKSDLKHDGKYIVGPDDLAIMFAALELCPPERVFRVTEPIYLYNHSEQNNFSRAHTDQKEASVDFEKIIRSRKPYDTLSFVTPTLAGGLGNQMFEIAAAASLAKDNGAILLVNPNNHILPNQGRNVNNYRTNIFENIIFDSAIRPESTYQWDKSTYNSIPYRPNCQLIGHFQSYKYFHHNMEYIRLLFNQYKHIPEVTNAMEKYYDLKITGIRNLDITAIQVRRGDYYKFPKHHPQLSPDYFHQAAKLVDSKEIWIFSDSIDWCKENLHFECPVVYINEPDYVEFYMISNFTKIIISNSSFGWWCSYLGNGTTNVYNQTIVPSTWFGEAMIDEGFNINDLVLPHWIKI